jgi:hypothetical protein
MNDHHKKQTKNKTDTGFELFPISTSRNWIYRASDGIKKISIKVLNFFLPSHECPASVLNAVGLSAIKTHQGNEWVWQKGGRSVAL